jgi:AhpD family alkylhydroperoxidase
MKSLVATLTLSLLPIVLSGQSLRAEDLPPFVTAVSPPSSAEPAFQEEMAVFNPNGALDGKTKELIALAVSAQVPCSYCIYGHTQGAKHFGATDAQIKEAIATSAQVRKWSTELQGNQYDLADFKKQVDAFYAASAKSQ